MIITTILVTCFFALAGVMQAPMADTFLLSLTVLSLPSLSAVSNIFTISSPMLVPSLPMPAVLEPFSDLLLQVTIPFTLPSKALGPASSASATYSPTPRHGIRLFKFPIAWALVILIWASLSLVVVVAVILIAPTCKSSIASVLRIKEHLLCLFDERFASPAIIITDYEGLAHSIGYTQSLDEISLPLYYDIDSTTIFLESRPLAASVSLNDIYFPPMTIDLAPLSQQVDEDALARTPGWWFIATGLEEVESLETVDRLPIDPTREVEEWAGPFRDDG
ncbi:hypothetical protein OH76DRAFT_1478450 [Lentinus brumalis]|uniref:Uncharacterized protein n=1 Tax=Lentinus brumalis TaxID=2498619 RepID=A0A371DQX2_9APHY|nr:hypothetical protein OH76DRAFT_1478450 [Polyporus brumalis]